MKLLLRSGADFTLRNGNDRTALEIAQEKGHKACEDLVSNLKSVPHSRYDERLFHNILFF